MFVLELKSHYIIRIFTTIVSGAPLKFDLSRLHNGNEMPEEDCGNDANDEDDDMVTGSVSPCPSATAAAADLLVPTSPMSITSTTNWMKIVMQTISRSGPELFEENDCPPFSRLVVIEWLVCIEWSIGSADLWDCAFAN